MLDNANRVLDAMEKGVRLERVNGRLWVVTKYGRKAAVLNGNGDALGCRYGALGMGGTQALATGQIVRWVRGLTRLPLRSWRYWTSERVALCSPDVVPLLESLDYERPECCRCVLCGRFPTNGLDWWCLGRVIGPCCSLGGCRYTRDTVPRAMSPALVGG